MNNYGRKMARSAFRLLNIDQTRFVYRVLAFRKIIFSIIDKRKDAENLMINIGGGSFHKRHWKNLDFVPENQNDYHYKWIGNDYNFDLNSLEPFPIKSNSVSKFYSAHTVEHLHETAFPHFFNEVYRCLKPGGMVRVTTPNFDYNYTLFANRNWDKLREIPAWHSPDRVQAIIELYGEATARRLGFDISEKRGRASIPIEEIFLADFDEYHAGKVSFEELTKNFETMTKVELADHYTKSIPLEWKRDNPTHSCWWNFEKMEKMLREAGFKEIYNSKAHKSKSSEMVGVGKYYGFDYLRPHSSLYVEAVK